jgi:hypothetical protein
MTEETPDPCVFTQLHNVQYASSSATGSAQKMCIVRKILLRRVIRVIADGG